MPFSIQQGLFNFDLVDYHAILGLPLNAPPEQVRTPYLKIAYQLHPDTCKAKTAVEKQRANELLSKFVNPAYENLSNATKRQEHQLLLSQVGAGLAGEISKVTLSSDAAQKLFKAGNQMEFIYPKLLKTLAQQQYQSLDWVLSFTAQISELNLVYLSARYDQLSQSSASGKKVYRTATTMPGVSKSEQEAAKSAAKATSSPSSSSSTSSTKASPPTNSQKSASQKPPLRQSSPPKSSPPKPSSETPRSPTEFYLRRAQDYIERGNYGRAIVEIKDSLKVDPNHAPSHGLMGLAYLKQQQLGMAKVHIKKAEAAAPQHPFVQQAKQELAKVTGESASSKDKGGGFLGGLFGGKRK